MDEDRARRVVAALRARDVMAHVVEAGVYEFGVRVVLDDGVEALWDVDGASGLDAEIVSDGVLVGYVPHVPGSEEFTERQIVDSIATTRYSLEGLRPPEDSPPAPSASPAADDASPRVPPPEERAASTPPPTRFQRWARWKRHGGS